jgi:hypothetical protein
VKEYDWRAATLVDIGDPSGPNIEKLLPLGEGVDRSICGGGNKLRSISDPKAGLRGADYPKDEKDGRGANENKGC